MFYKTCSCLLETSLLNFISGDEVVSTYNKFYPTMRTSLSVAMQVIRGGRSAGSKGRVWTTGPPAGSEGMYW